MTGRTVRVEPRATAGLLGKTRFDSAVRVLSAGVPASGLELFAVYRRCADDAEREGFFRAVQAAVLRR